MKQSELYDIPRALLPATNGSILNIYLQGGILRPMLPLLLAIFAIPLSLISDASRLGVLGIIVAFLLFFFLPGLIVTEFLLGNKDRDWLETIAFSFSLGLGALMLPAMLFLYYGAELSKLIFFYRMEVLFLALMMVIFALRRLKNSSAVRPVQKANIWTYLFLAILAVFSLLAFRIGAVIYPYHADAFFHLASARKLLELPRLSPNNPFYTGFPPDSVYGYNGWHLVLAMLSKYTGLDLLTVWRLLPVLLGWLFGLSIYAFAKRLIGQRRPALLTAILYVLVSGLAEAGGIWYFSPYPSTIASLILIPILFSAFMNREINGLRKLILLMLLAFTAGFVHFFTLAFALLFLFVYLTLSFVFSARSGRVKSLPVWEIVALLGGTAPAALTRFVFFRMSPTKHLLAEWISHSSKQILYMNRFFFLENPFRRLAVDPLLLIAIIGVPFFFREARRGSTSGTFLFSVLALSLGINFNPIVLPLVSRLVALPLWLRLFDTIPSAIPAGAFLFIKTSDRVLNWEIKSVQRVMLIFALGLLVLATINPLSMPSRPTGKPIYRLVFDPPAREPFPGIAMAAERLKQVIKIAQPAVIVSDPLTSQVIPAYVNAYIVETEGGRGSSSGQENTTAFKRRPALRLVDISKIFNPDVGPVATRNLIRKYQGTIVFINKTVPGVSEKKFQQDPQFIEIFDDGRYAAFWLLPDSQSEKIQSAKRRIFNHPWHLL